VNRIEAAGGSLSATVTGPLRRSGGHKYTLEVRRFSVP